MKFYLDIKIFLYMLSAILSLSTISYFLVKGRKNTLLFSYIICQSMALIWTTGQLMRSFATNLGTLWFIVRIAYSGICFMGVSWLFFCLVYTKSKILTQKLMALLLLMPPAALYLLLLTNEQHHLFYSVFTYAYQERGLFFWGHAVFSYVYFLLGTIVLITYSIRSSKSINKQTILLIIAALIPFITTFTFNVIIPSDLALTPISFIFSLLITFTIFKFRFLNIRPIILQSMVNNVKEAILVVDYLNEVVDFNESFTRAFAEVKLNKNQSALQHFIDSITGQIENIDAASEIIQAISRQTKTPVYGELTLKLPEPKCFWVSLQPIFWRGKDVLGKAISFTDITDYKKLLNELDQKNSELMGMNSDLLALNDDLSRKNALLQDYTVTAEELAAAKERSRMAQEIHDTIGQTMTLMVTLMEAGYISCQNPLAREQMTNALEITRNGLADLRGYIREWMKK